MTTLLLQAPGRETGTTSYTLRIASTADEVAAAQRLRYEVFAQELGARLATPLTGHDIDAFDSECDHLIISADRTGEVVATYRLLPPGRMPVRYGDAEFDLGPLEPIGRELVEAGRSCVHPDHRDGAAINLLWAGIARYMHLYNHRYLAGCASVGLADGGVTAATVARKSLQNRPPAGFRVTPRTPWTAPEIDATAHRPIPPLLRGYLRLGAWICGDPAYDPAFDCADFYVLLDTHAIAERYRRHFLGGTP
jgi:putative hemolysin